jgi:hypothetical protein
MHNLGQNYMSSEAVTDAYRWIFLNKTDIQGYTTVSFVEGEGLPSL